MKCLLFAVAAVCLSACAPPLPTAPYPVSSNDVPPGPPASLTLTTSGSATAAGEVLINLTVRDATGRGVPSIAVTLTSTAGTFDRPIVTTGPTGTAQSLLTTTKSATVTATGAGLTASAKVSAAFTPLTLGATANPPTPHKGDGVTFTASVSGGSAPYSYAWVFGDGGTGTGASVSHRYFSDGSKTISLTVTDADDRTGTTSTSVSVQPDPVPPVIVPPIVPTLAALLTCTPAAHGTPTVCNVTATFGGTPVIATAITNVDWNWGDGLMDLGTTSPVRTHTYTNAGTYTVFAFVSVPLLSAIPAEAAKTLLIP
jgi:PKD repeat protein